MLNEAVTIQILLKNDPIFAAISVNYILNRHFHRGDSPC